MKKLIFILSFLIFGIGFGSFAQDKTWKVIVSNGVQSGKITVSDVVIDGQVTQTGAPSEGVLDIEYYGLGLSGPYLNEIIGQIKYWYEPTISQPVITRTSPGGASYITLYNPTSSSVTVYVSQTLGDILRTVQTFTVPANSPAEGKQFLLSNATKTQTGDYLEPGANDAFYIIRVYQ